MSLLGYSPRLIHLPPKLDNPQLLSSSRLLLSSPPLGLILSLSQWQHKNKMMHVSAGAAAGACDISGGGGGGDRPRLACGPTSGPMTQAGVQR